MSLPQPCSLGAEAFVPCGGDDLRLQGHQDDLDADARLWRIPDGRHYQVACFHCMSVRNPGSLLVGGTPGPLSIPGGPSLA